jgi:carboxymethylenebutenolidase
MRVRCLALSLQPLPPESCPCIAANDEATMPPMMQAIHFFVLLILLLGDPSLAVAQGIPPNNERVPLVLKESLRHGEWVDVDLPGADVKIKSFVVYPERKEKAPVVIVIHEIFGMTDWVRGVADTFAAEGFIAIAPDLLSGMGPDGGGTESLGSDVRSVIRGLSPEDRGTRLNAVRTYALALPAATDRSGCVGFCWGGSTSFIYATRQSGLNAAVVYYGTAPDSKEELGKINCPVLGLYGGDDARVTTTVAPTKNLMQELNKSYSTHVYDGAGHGFLRQQSKRDGANLAASKKAWSTTIEFFKEHLEQPVK